ncbi:uncharacterized protein [Oscarella lobularis]|uniref:uncharacterized protein isoform X2 n=1 Tax=Oscarella lobularis TaxID=121494 RepID=UPI0033136DBF
MTAENPTVLRRDSSLSMLKQKSPSQKGGAFAPKFPGGRKSMGRGRVLSSQIMKLAGVDQDETYKKSLQAMDQLRAVKANLAQVMDSAEKASTEFPADKLHDEDHMADKERVWSILEDYEKLCTEREKVLFSLEHFFNTSKEDPSMRRRQIPIILEDTDWSSDHETDDDDTSDQDKEAKREFEKAFTVAQESAIRLKDLNAEVVHIATLINRIALGNFNWKANPFSDLKGILRQVTDSNYVAETKVLEAQSMFDQLIASVHDIARRNSQLKKAKSDQEKQLDASIARNVSLKTENESLKGAIRTPELELEKARKELDALREEVREKSDKVEECTALIEDLVDEKKTLVVEIETTSATSQEVLNEKSKLVQQKNEELKKQSLVIKRLEDESKRKADRIRELETSVAAFASNAAVAAPPPPSATADATSTFVDGDDDDHTQLIAENCDLKRELTRCRHRIRYLEELVRSFLLKRKQTKSTHVLPELPLPSVANDLEWRQHRRPFTVRRKH